MSIADVVAQALTTEDVAASSVLIFAMDNLAPNRTSSLHVMFFRDGSMLAYDTICKRWVNPYARGVLPK